MYALPWIEHEAIVSVYVFRSITDYRFHPYSVLLF